MRQKDTPHKGSVLSALIASVCIIVYLAALVFAAIRIYANTRERHLVAEREFYDIADLAAAAGVLGFMDEPFIQTMYDALNSSRPLLALIISGPNGEYAFEKEPGTAINWVNNSPRFKTRFDISREPLYQPLQIPGQRNVNIQAVARTLDYGLIISILRQTLLAILAALALAFFTLLLESLIGKKPAPVYQDGPRQPPPEEGRRNGAGVAVKQEPARYEETPTPEAPPPAGKNFAGEDPAGPRGLYSPNGNIGWEDYTQDRLAAELHRCASFEQDLVFIIMEFKERLPGGFYRQFAEDAVNFFTLRDLIFERGERGISIIYPNIDLDQGFSRSEEFHNRILSKYSGSFRAKTDLCIGLSSRAGRLVDAERIIFEATEALERALADPVSHIVAFKSDPEKYRAFVRRGLETPET
ncbi:MAG: hypothetical protein LBK27_06080 [Treponema sp.]|jgi:hypothetical protein|nr:hypothetical protein [Treponema sp.]